MNIDPTTTSLTLHLGRTRAATMDVAAALRAICAALPSRLGIAGAVVLLSSPEPLCTASDRQAQWFAEVQQHVGTGPLPDALRTGQAGLSPDLTRIAPPELADAAARCGLGSSLVLVVEVDGERFGCLQLLGDLRRPVDATHADLVRPLVEALAARLADVAEFARLRNVSEVATTALPVVPPQRLAPRTSGRPSPSPRRLPRHSRSI